MREEWSDVSGDVLLHGKYLASVKETPHLSIYTHINRFKRVCTSIYMNIDMYVFFSFTLSSYITNWSFKMSVIILRFVYFTEQSTGALGWHSQHRLIEGHEQHRISCNRLRGIRPISVLFLYSILSLREVWCHAEYRMRIAARHSLAAVVTEVYRDRYHSCAFQMCA